MTARSMISKEMSSNAIVANPDCLRKTTPACPDHEDKNAFDRYFVQQMIVAAAPVMCDSVYTYCDAEHRPRLACPNRMCCSLCNMVGDMQRCTNQEHVETFENELERVIGDRETIKNELSKVIDDPAIIERVLEALDYIDWLTPIMTISVGILACRIVDQCYYEAFLVWPESQLPFHEDRRKEPPPDTECQTQCDSREAWLNSTRFLRGFAFSGQPF